MRASFRQWVALLPTVLVVTATAETLPTKGAVDSRIRTALYSADEVYRLRGFVGYGIELIFEPGEAFVGQGSGDLDGIAFAAHDNHLILKPKAANVSTNLVVYTTHRAYRFHYSVSARRPETPDEIIYAVRFLYSPKSEPASGPTSAELIERELLLAKAARPRNHDYWFCGKRSVKPVAASDDGVHTRLTFGAKSELPAIFVRNADGSESLLNFHLDGGDVVIQRVAEKFILRRGKLTGCVVNKGFTGGGERLDSGTVAPGVTRERKESRP